MLFYVPDAAGLPILVLEDVCANHIAGLPHVVLQVLPLSFKAEVADEEPSAFHTLAISVSLFESGWHLAFITSEAPMVLLVVLMLTCSETISSTIAASVIVAALRVGSLLIPLTATIASA